MITRTALSSVALALALAGCGGGTPDTVSGPARQVTSPGEIRLAVGEEVRVDGLLRIGFSGVPGDSRCPASVVCIWQGDAAVEIHYGLGQGPSYPDTLHTALDPKGVSFAGYQIALVEVAPYPYAPGPIPLGEYVIRVRVAR